MTLTQDDRHEPGRSATDAPRSGPLRALDDADAPLYTVGQVSELLDVPVAQLRRLDVQEIVQPHRSEGNQRRYTRREIERLREVLELTGEGLTLAGVRRVLALQDRVAELEQRLTDAERRLQEVST